MLEVSVEGGFKASRRLHITAGHFAAPWSMAGAFVTERYPELSATRWGKLRCRYLTGRTLGEEQSYILARQKLVAGSGASMFPGNSLPRPGLLLNPWSIGKTQTDRQEAKSGDSYSKVQDSLLGSTVGGAARRRAAGRGGGGGGSGSGGVCNFAAQLRSQKSLLHEQNVDFLPSPSRVLFNMPIPADGVVRIPLTEIAPGATSAGDGGRGASPFLTLMCIDSVHSAVRHVALREKGLPGSASRYRSLILQQPLNPSLHVIQQRRVKALLADEEHSLTAASDTKVSEYETLESVFTLFGTLSNDSVMRLEFNWLLQWPTLSDAAKAEKYSKYCCHEVNLFLWKKDPAFFTKVRANEC